LREIHAIGPSVRSRELDLSGEQAQMLAYQGRAGRTSRRRRSPPARPQPQNSLLDEALATG